ANWKTEPSYPSLEGAGFWRLAIDPGNPDRVMAATTQGIYQRKLDAPDGLGHGWFEEPTSAPPAGDQWDAKSCSGLAVARQDGVTHFYAALKHGRGIYHWHENPDLVPGSWTAVNTGLPLKEMTTIALAMQPNNAEVIYALAADDHGKTVGVF